MKFSEIASRLTGFSTPIFGVSWNPPEAHCAVARRLITFLEDRRVLYVPSEVEIPDHCVQSVLEIRRVFTKELGALDTDTELGQSISAMRTACRKFLATVEAEDGRIIRFGASQGHYASWIFISALGELRGVIGIHVAKVAAAYGLDVESDLASIFPEASDAHS
ncbi:MAG: DUF6650 family protein [Gammaproteobacteria bacterium]